MINSIDNSINKSIGNSIGNSMENYIEILIDSLKKKKNILEEILEQNRLQREAFEEDSINDELFEKAYSKKDELIAEINRLDEGFNSVFERVKEELNANKEGRLEEIKLLKQLVSEVTQKSMEVQLDETNNKKLIEKKMTGYRKNVHQTKAVNQVVARYSAKMNNLDYIEPQFLDKKK